MKWKLTLNQIFFFLLVVDKDERSNRISFICLSELVGEMLFEWNFLDEFFWFSLKFEWKFVESLLFVLVDDDSRICFSFLFNIGDVEFDIINVDDGSWFISGVFNGSLLFRRWSIRRCCWWFDDNNDKSIESVNSFENEFSLSNRDKFEDNDDDVSINIVDSLLVFSIKDIEIAKIIKWRK